MVDIKDSEWHKLDWARKVELCEQGRVNENNLLQNDRFIFIALETILFAATFGVAWGNLWALVFAFVGIGLAILWVHVTDLRGNAVDRWEEILSGLWAKVAKSEAGVSELTKHYTGAVERRKRRKKGGRQSVILGWGGFGRLRSARWVFTTLIPSLMITGWLAVMAVTIIGAFDC
jgi:hypothetical protein